MIMLCLMCSQHKLWITLDPHLWLHVPYHCAPWHTSHFLPSSTKDPPDVSCCCGSKKASTTSSLCSSSSTSGSSHSMWSLASGLVLAWCTGTKDCMFGFYLKLLLLLVLIPQQTLQVPTHAGNFTGMHDNVSQIIEELLDGYDIRLRPQFGGKYKIRLIYYVLLQNVIGRGKS